MALRIQRKSRKQQAQEAELGLIIDEMGQAMWNANKKYINYDRPMTPAMSNALAKFQDYCEKYGA